jgi:hypothetical protein
MKVWYSYQHRLAIFSGRFDMWRYLIPMVLIPTVASADPVSAAVALISSGVAVATGAIAATAFWTHFATTFALSTAAKLLSPDVKDVNAGNNLTGYDVAGLAPATDHAIVYGKTKVGGAIVYKETTENNKYLHIVVALAGHEIENVEEVYLNDEKLTFYTLGGEVSSPPAQGDLGGGVGNVSSPSKYSSKVRVMQMKGTDTQSAVSQLYSQSAGLWTADHRLQGVAYIYIRLEFDQEAFPQGEPQISAVIKGKKVYNPNTETTAWSANTALCLRDYLTSGYGINADSDEIDDTSFITAMNVCDEDVTLAAGGTENRYEVNGSFTTGTQPDKVIESLTKSMAGSVWYAQGKFRVKAGAYTTPVYTFDEDDLRGNLQIQTRRSRQENFNIVNGKFSGEESNWMQTDYPEVRLSASTITDIDGGEEIKTSLDLPFTSTSTMAQRIAKILLFRNREQIVVNATMGLRAMQVQVGDIIKLTNTRAGWTEKTFEVLAWQFAPTGDTMLEVNLTLGEISSDVYDWSAEETAFETNNTSLADAFIAPPVSVNVVTEARVINEGVFTVLGVTIDSASPERIDFVEVEYKKSTDSVFTQAGVGELGLFEIIDVENTNYDIRARSVNTFGIRGEYELRQNYAVNAFVDAPDDVTNFNATVGGALLNLEWEAVDNLDLSFYRIRHAVEESGASWANATTAVYKVARPANSVTVPARSGTYTIRAYDKLGINSTNYTSVVVPAVDLEDFINTSSQAEHSSFSGSKTNLTVTSGNLRLTSTTNASESSPATGTYDFSNYIDTGSVRRVRARIDAAVTRFNAGAGLWDDIAGNWDTWSGLWDSWSDPQFADHNCLFYISTTNDNPASSPTWSDYKLFKAGDFSGRAFRFRVVLVSEAENISPSIDELTAVVEYN